MEFSQEQSTIHPVTGRRLVTKAVDGVLCHGCYVWEHRDNYNHCPLAVGIHNICYREFWKDGKNRIWVEAGH